MSRCATIVISFAVPAILLPAQEAGDAVARESMRGSAVLSDGSPWAGATVILLAHSADAAPAQRERIEVTTDVKGRFVASLRTGRRYSAFAYRRPDDDTECVSPVVDDLHIGRPLELVADAPRKRPSLEIDGIEPWLVRGEVTVRCAWSLNGSRASMEPVRGLADRVHATRLEACRTARLVFETDGVVQPLAKATFGVMGLDLEGGSLLAAAVGPVCAMADIRGVAHLPLYPGLGYSLGYVHTAAGYCHPNLDIDVAPGEEESLPTDITIEVGGR